MDLPLEPGVYIMKNRAGDIIYIGKAKVLKNRVSQYFGSPANHGIKTRKMVENADDFEYIVVGSEYEALVLECSLIKQYRPKYNILLKDDKGYHYVKISADEIPKITPEKQKTDDGAQYIGPYTSSFYVTKAVEEAVKIYKLHTCSKVFPRDYNKSRPCLNYSIGLCSAPCAGKISLSDYAESVKSAIEFLKTAGRSASVKDMEREMYEASERCEFEKAARLRDRIRALQKISEKQVAVLTSQKQADVFAAAYAADAMCLSVLRINEGRIYDSENFLVDVPEDAPNEFMQLITGYYSLRSDAPKSVITDFEIEDAEMLRLWLSDKFGKTVRVSRARQGENLRLAEMCRNNAVEHLSRRTAGNGRDMRVLDELAVLLGLKTVPAYIESYDISHTAGADAVAGMIVFRDGKPYRSAYRRFMIKDAKGGDDPAAMYEVASRRAQRFLDEKGGEGFGRLPDLMLIDGGMPQVEAVKAALCEKGIELPVFGMVKDSKHRTRAIVSENGEISLNMNRRVFGFVGRIQEEVHRYSIEYHRKKRSAPSRYSSLTKINGIGEKRAKALFSHFKSIEKIRLASVDELSLVPGISRTAAENIFEFFHGDN